MKGYKAASRTVLLKINDIPVKSLAHTLELIENCDSTFIHFEMSNDMILVFDVSEAKAK